ncbi:PAS domain S-box protein, partial [Oxalobacteraceae bacterium OM1]
MPESRSTTFDFLLPAGGEMGRRIREFDWTQTPLGPPDGWPAALKTALNMMLCARFPMFLAWGDALIYFYNDAFIDILAVRHPDALGRRFSELAPEAWDTVSVLVGQTLAGQPAFHKDLPFRLRRKGYEETAWFTVSYSPVCDDQHRIAGVLGICVETTQRIQEDKERQTELTWLRDMFEQAPVPIIVLMGPDHRYEISNAANQELLGNRPVVGLPVRHALPEAEEQGFTAILDEVYRTGRPFIARDMPIHYRRPDGTLALAYMNVIYQPIRSRDGEIIGIFGIAGDTTQAVTATRGLKAGEQRLRTLVDAVPQMVWSAAPDGTNRFFNKQWYDFTGLPEGSLNGWEAVHPDDRAANTVHWKRCVATGEPYEVKNRLRHRSGEYRWTLVRALPVRDEDGRIVE